MRKLFAALYKETLILFRDLPGLLILFLMPVILILIVTVAQENAVKWSRESKSEILVLDESRSVISNTITQSLEKSGFYKLIKTVHGKYLNEDTLTKLVFDGKYPFGIILKQKDSAIRILTDPALQEQYKNSTVTSLTFLIKSEQSRMAVVTLLKTMIPGMDETVDKMIRSSMDQMPPVTEVYPVKDRSVIQPSMSQNCIPGFILFAMFFIVIPLSGSMINEKSAGSFIRLKTLPVSVSLLLASKVAGYLVVCLIQFALMLMIGVWVLPAFFGLPAFHPGNQYLAILLTTIASSLAAIGFGLIVGASSTTHAQAALFGSVMVVILGIISGSFLPIHMFPKVFQYVSLISPIRWGIDNYLDIFIRGESLITILPNILLLLLFFIFALIISGIIFARPK